MVASDAVGVADAREAVRPPHGAAGHPATQVALPVATPSALEGSLMVYCWAIKTPSRTGLRDRGLRHGRETVVVREGAQVLEQLLDLIGRRRHERR